MILISLVDDLARLFDSSNDTVTSLNMSHPNLKDLAHEEMLHRGFHPDFSDEVRAQLADLESAARPPAGTEVRDLRGLLWSSIDNDTSRDLDQIEVAESLPSGDTRILIGIADVDSMVSKSSAIDLHAQSEATSVYTGVQTFPMLPQQLSEGITSLLEGVDRLSVVIEFIIDGEAAVHSGTAYVALVRNQAQLTYSGVGPWLEASAGPPAKIAGSAALQDQIKLQDEAAQRLRAARYRLGALNIDSIETMPTLSDGQVTGIHAVQKNRASQLIEDLMIAANGVIARMLSTSRVSSIRRVVKTPERWDRIVELASGLGERLPAQPDSLALSEFLLRRRAADPVHSPDLSLAVIKLMGPGEYVVQKPGDPDQGHFGLAAHDYTHSTAPNRRYADLVTQRLVKAVLDKRVGPYSDDQLQAIARNCTLKEDAARKVERDMRKRIAAVALSNRVGETFRAVVTGVTPRGTFVRTLDPPADGLVVRGDQGLDVGDQIRVMLVDTNPERGFIDFARD
jgi:exoribonuclease-2